MTNTAGLFLRTGLLRCPMKCDDIEQLILLAESGELPPDRRREIDDHMASCARCSRYREEAGEITRLAAGSLPAEPSPFLVSRILAYAGSRSAHSPRVLAWIPHPRLLALAATLLVAACAWVTLFRPGKSDPVTDVHTLAALMSVETETDTGIPVSLGSPSEDALRALARELLRVEGFAADEFLEQDIPPGEASESDA